MKICPDCKRQWEDWIELCFVDGTPLQPLRKPVAVAPPLPALPEYTDELKKSPRIPEEDNEPTFIPNNTPLPPPPEARGLEAPHHAAAAAEPVVDDTPLESVVPSILPPVDESTSDTESHFSPREHSVSAFQTLMPMDEEEGRATTPIYPPMPGDVPPSMARVPVQEAAPTAEKAPEVVKAPEKAPEKAPAPVPETAPAKAAEVPKTPEPPKPPEPAQGSNRAPVGMAVAGLTAVGVVVVGMLIAVIGWKLTHTETEHPPSSPTTVPENSPTPSLPVPEPAPVAPTPAAPAPAAPTPAVPAPAVPVPAVPVPPAPVAPAPAPAAALPTPATAVPTPAPAVIGEGILTILPNPADARIFVDGVDSGQGVISVSLPFGKHDIKIVREGYHTETTTVDFKRTMSLPRKLNPEAVPVSVALDCADTAPCSVVIDDKASIKLPTNQELPAGRHSFRLTNGDGEMCTVYRDLTPDTSGTPAKFTLECP